MSQEQLAGNPQIGPLLRRIGVTPNAFIEILRCDDQPESIRVVQKWDTLTPMMRSRAGLEAVALASGLTPRRVWELFAGATLIQSREIVGIKIAQALPVIMDQSIRQAKKAKGTYDREHVLKAARVLPIPRGSTTVINMPDADKQLEDGDDDDGYIKPVEPADEFLMKASRAMGAKALPAPKVVEAEIIEEDEDEEEE